MRKVTLLLSMMVLAAMILAACGGGATSTSVSPTQVPQTAVATESPVATEPGVPVTGSPANPAGRMSERMKAQVMDQTGNKIGTVSDLILDLSKAQVIYVIVNDAGKKIPVPRSMFTIQGAAGTGTGSSTSTPGASSSSLSTSTPAGVATGLAGSVGTATSAPTTSSDTATAAPTTS